MVLIPGPFEQSGLAVVAPFDFALDRELWRWAPGSVTVHLNRVGYVTVPVGVELAYAVNSHVAVRQAALELVATAPLVCAYLCSSGSFIDGLPGEKRLCDDMTASGMPTAVTTSGAMVEAMAHLGVRSVAVATPYVADLAERLELFLAEAGLETVSSAHLGLPGGIWQVPYDGVASLVLEADHPDAEAIFVSCTNLPTYDLIAPLERELGKPVLTANQVTMWSALRRMGQSAVGPGQRLCNDPGGWDAHPSVA
ncbi:MAG TPA: Asp/Glu racemase [Nocardioidaceae bacterium]|jgi:maleate isomerase